MSFFDFFKKNESAPPKPSSSGTANHAMERLQVVVAHRRNGNLAGTPSWLPKMQQEVMAVVAKYMPVSEDNLKVQIDRDGDCEVLELNITLPDHRA